MAANRFRLKFMFWLDVSKSDELGLAEMVDDLKEKRLFSKTLRDGIRLICDLRAGNLDVLLELFPWVRAEMPQQPAAEASLQQQLERLERLLIEQGNTPIMATSQPTAAPNGGIKKLAVPQIAPPVFDDDDDVELVVRKAKDDGSSARNFLESAFALQK